MPLPDRILPMTTTLRDPDTFTSACPPDCPHACSLEGRGEGGGVVKVDGTRRNPLTEGYICSKVRHLPEHLYGPDRILHPARRVGPKGSGEFERISWDAALDLAAERLRGGGESILPLSYGGFDGPLRPGPHEPPAVYRPGAAPTRPPARR